MLIVLVLYRAVPSKQDRYSVEKCATSSIWRDGLQHEGEPTFDRGNAHKKHTNRHKTAVRKCPHSQKCTQHLLTSYLKVIRSDLFATFVFVGWQHTFPLCVGFVVSLFEQQVAAEYRVPWCSGRHCIKLFMAMSKIQKGARLTREQQHKSVWAERTAPRDNTYISLHHLNAILRMLVLQKCILHLKVGY